MTLAEAQAKLADIRAQISAIGVVQSYGNQGTTVNYRKLESLERQEERWMSVVERLERGSAVTAPSFPSRS